MHIHRLAPLRCLGISQSNKQRRGLQFLTRTSTILGLVKFPRTVFRRCPRTSLDLSCRLKGIYLIRGLRCPLEIEVLICQLLGATLRNIRRRLSPIPVFGSHHPEVIPWNQWVLLPLTSREPVPGVKWVAGLALRSLLILSGAKGTAVTPSAQLTSPGPTGDGMISSQCLRDAVVMMEGSPGITFNTRPTLTGSSFLPVVLNLGYLWRLLPISAGIVVEVTQRRAIMWVGLLRHTRVNSPSTSDRFRVLRGRKFCPVS